MKLVRVLSGLFALATCSCLGRTLYVSPVGSQTLPFTSWATAAREIQMAARFALDGDIIVVTNGTYKPFIVLTRAAQLVSVNGPEHTIIDGVIDRLQGGRCLEVTGGGLVKGFTVRRGNSPEDGGGIWIGEGTIESCVIEDNVSGAKGGGVYCEDDAVVLNCVIRRNQAASSGGGVAMAWGGHLRNCLIVDNQSLGDSGGGVACEWDGAIWNCTITRNRAELTGGGLRFETDGWVVNSIVYGNEAGRSHSNVDGSEVLFECCCSVPKPEGENNLSADPAFLAPEEGDCRLAVSSPCVDAGRNEPRMQGETDLEGLPRIQNRAVDLGAYEAGALRCGFRVTPKEGEQPLLDVAFDAYVTGTNLVGLQYAWDLDGDGQFETAEGPAATYSFSAAGTFSPLLMVRNAAGEEASLRRRDCIRVVAPLVADFIAAPLLGSAPMTVRFTDQSRGSPTNWAWDFDHDDIIDSTAQNPSHTYQSPGQYTVTLTVRRRPGTAEESVASLTRRDYVHLPGYALEAAFRAELDTARIGEPVQFRDETRHATGGERWAWDFDGDGQSDSAERHPLHTFGSAGSKIVELVVSNTYSLSRTSRLALVVFGLTRSHYVSLQGGHVAPFVTWATAATNVQAAIDAAEAADTVVFAPGVYGLSRPLEVTHEMTLISAEGPLRTVLDGGGTTTCLRLRNRFAAVEGLTIRNGASSADGGGVDLLGTMRHCRVVACRATRGGGVRAGPGAALLDCVIEGNEAATGGGVYFESNSTLERCILRGNVAAEDGGGVYGVGGRLRNLLIVENWARRGTGADLALSSVESCTIVRNLSQDSLTEGLRCGWDLKAINSIIYHNAGQNLYAGGGLFEHCCLLPDPGGLGNITAPPKLVPGGYQLSWASPCRDVGTNQTWMTDAVDLAQAPRLQNGVTDLGCQELGHFVCGFDLSPRTGTIPLLARIEGGAGATNALPVHYFWDLDGDGRYDRDGLNMTTLTHEYANEGTYTVALLASNTVGELAYFIRTNVLVAYASRVRYVSAEGSHTPPFTSWPTAATNLQAALDVARDADQVLLTNGLYRSGAPVVVNKAVRVSSVHGALTAILDGEGAYRCIVLAHTNAVVEGLTLTGGMAEDGGGGYVRQGLVRLCRVMGNVATRYGGGLHVEGNSTVRGCLLADNQAAWGGGLSLAGEPKIEAVTIAGNRARSGGGLVVQQWGKPQLINSIIYHNQAEDGYDLAGGANYHFFQHCCYAGVAEINGNVNRDPQFLSLSHSDYHLAADSPCVNAGTNVAASIETTDLDGAARVVQNAVDIGCFEMGPLRCGIESSPASGLAPVSVALIARISGANLAGLTYEWDFNNDGLVDASGADLATQTNVYTNSGRHAAALRVLNADGQTATFTAPNLVTVYATDQHYVAGGGAHQWPYDTWERAATNLAAALDAAPDGHQITAADGIYREPTLVLRRAVVLRSLNGPQTTVIDGENARQCLRLEHPAAVVDGFTVRGGLAQGHGGGVYLRGGVLTNCLVSSNRAEGAGGGVYIDAQGVSGGTVVRCTVSDNQALQSGGGVYCYHGGNVLDCVIIDNRTLLRDGGGVACFNLDTGKVYARIRGCRIQRNVAKRGGGGVHFNNSGSSASRCVIADNQADVGGGVCCDWGGTVNTSYIHGNTARKGGGVAAVLIGGADYCTIVRNRATEGGGGVYFAGGEAFLQPHADGCMIYYNEGGNYLHQDAAPEYSHCCIVPNPGGREVLTQEPRLVFGFRLRPDSPCIDAGGDASAQDLDGELPWDHPLQGAAGLGPRDIGADEYVDQDQDGMADAWERDQLGDLARSDGSSDADRDDLLDADEYYWGTSCLVPDTDGDGMIDGHEVLADTNPADRQSFLGFVSIALSQESLELTWKGGLRATQILERRESSLTVGPWQAVFTNQAVTPVTNSWLESAPTSAQRSYRLRIPTR